MKEKIYAPREFGKLVGRTVKTLQRWDNAGILIAHRSPTNRRYYTDTQYINYLEGNFKKEENPKGDLVFVS